MVSRWGMEAGQTASTIEEAIACLDGVVHLISTGVIVDLPKALVLS